MWAPIFDQNESFLTKALDEYIAHLQRFRHALADRDVQSLHNIMTEANDIRRVLADLGPNGMPDKNSDTTNESAVTGEMQ